VSFYDLARVGFFLFGVPRNGFGSIDVTTRCNLGCRHCYHQQQEHLEDIVELSVEQWISRLEEIRRSVPRWQFPFFNCSWVGGEPLLRQDLVQRCLRYFRYNTVVTNGTIPLPRWERVSWYVSVDGDREAHDLVRQQPGCHERVLGNVRRNLDLGITIACCVNRLNAHCVEQVVRDWYDEGVKHVTFDFHTPMEGEEDDLWLPPPERDRVLDRLLALREIYGDFFVIPRRVLELMRSDNAARVTGDCLLRTHGFAWDAAGWAKGKCVMGPAADCARCGCVVPFYLRALTDRRMILKDLVTT